MIPGLSALQIDQSARRVDKVFLVEARRRGAHGPQTPILMVHGAFHGWWAYEPWLAYFATLGFPAFALSLRGHEGAERLDEATLCRTGLADYAADVGAAIDAIGEPVILIGHSLGGLISQMAAAARGDVRGLVLVGSAGPGALGPTRDFLWPEDRGLLFPPERMRRSMFHSIDDGAFAAIYGRLVPESPRALNESGVHGVSISPTDIAAPILVLGTEHDGIGLHPTQSIADYYGADSLTVPGTSHDCLLEAAGLAAAHEVLRWILARKLDRSDIA